MIRINNRIENSIAILISGLLAVLFGFNSPLHPWIGGCTEIDSSVFKTVTLMIERGYMPYKDSFDHKGPFLYVLNWLGNRISQYRGIWVIEMVVIGITFFFMYKISRLSCGAIASIVTTLVSVSPLFDYFEGGNFTEEYAMPCIAVSIYIFLDYLKNKVISKKRILIAGLCCGIVLMLRPNMISVWIVFCLVITVNLVLRKEIKRLGYFTLWFVVGLSIVIVPLLMWLAVNGAFGCFVQDYIVFNVKYTSAEGGRALLSSKWDAFFSFFNTPIFIIAFFSLLFNLKRDDKLITISYLVYLVLTVVLMVMSGMAYLHYGMILVPAVVWPISLVFMHVERITDKSTSELIVMILTLYFLSNVIMPNWINTIKGAATAFENKNKILIEDYVSDIVQIIQANTDENDAISVYGNWDVIYVLSNRIHATKYSYQFPIGEVMPEIMKEYIAALQKELPPVIVIQPGHFDDNIQEFLNNNDYEIQYSSNEDSSISAMACTRRRGAFSE